MLVLPPVVEDVECPDETFLCSLFERVELSRRAWLLVGWPVRGATFGRFVVR